MKILVLHQPFPMGNYKLNEYLSNYFSKIGHETYLLQQLNGMEASGEYITQIKELDPDLIYFEMLDIETFKIIENLNCEKILLHASNGVLGEHEKIVDYHGKWFDKIMTNSKKMYDLFISKGFKTEFFEYYFSVLGEEDLQKVDKYSHDCVFLGMGFHRLESPSYKIDKDMYFDGFGLDIDFKIYGNGWPQFAYYGGLLPPDDIGKLYFSAKSGIAIIGESQRNYGQINNRYTEMGYSGLPIITQNYENIDWFGAEKYLNFVSSKYEAEKIIFDIITAGEKYKDKANKMKQFIKIKHEEFLQKLNNLLKS